LFQTFPGNNVDVPEIKSYISVELVFVVLKRKPGNEEPIVVISLDIHLCHTPGRKNDMK
jgi:hypothetical protein